MWNEREVVEDFLFALKKFSEVGTFLHGLKHFKHTCVKNWLRCEHDKDKKNVIKRSYSKTLT